VPVATHVVCRVITMQTPRAAGSAALSPSILLVLDAATGARVAERPLGSTVSTLAIAGPSLLLVELQPDGHGTVVRENPSSGDVLWSFRTSRPLPDLGSGLPVPTASVQHGVIAVDGPAAWALTPAGSLLGEWYPLGTRVPPGVRRVVDLTALPDERFAVTDATTGDDGVRVAGSVVTTGAPASGSERSGRDVPSPPDGFPIPGRILATVVDDGSAPDVVLTVPVGEGQVIALDAGSGRELWRVETRVGAGSVLIDRRLVVGTGRGVRGLDVRSGEVRWVAGPDVVPSGPDMLSDGEVVLVPVLQPGRRPALVALGITDGRERWRAPVPAGVLGLRPLGDRVLALTARDTVALG
jgi:outer membrane protein assembly factor BamB